MKLRQLFPLLFIALLARGTMAAEQPVSQSIILASTTSVENSGLLAHILPAFTKETGITVHVLAQGTGQALETAARDDADLVLVHDLEAEQKFIAAGDGIDRRQIAWNDFIVVGPRSDPAHIAGTHDAVAALKAIAAARAPFVSRGDKSGTDALEHRLWRVAGIDPAKADGGSWYRDIGGGMGAALRASDERLYDQRSRYLAQLWQQGRSHRKELGAPSSPARRTSPRFALTSTKSSAPPRPKSPRFAPAQGRHPGSRAAPRSEDRSDKGRHPEPSLRFDPRCAGCKHHRDDGGRVRRGQGVRTLRGDAVASAGHVRA